MNRKTIGYISIITLLAVTSFVSVNQYFRERSMHDEIDIRMFPYTVGDWKGKELEVAEKTYEILETRNLISREYTNSANDKIFLFIIYSETNRSVFHPPEVCLMGGGIEIVDKQTESIDYNEKQFSANKLYTQRDNYKGISLYCYKTGKLHTDNFYLQQAYFALGQLLRGHVKGATIRVTMVLKEDEEAQLDIMKNFVRESARIIDGM
jgi:EpsI family protein